MKKLIYFEGAAFDAQTVSIDFDGTTEWMQTFPDADLNTTSPDNWTASIWIKPAVDNVSADIMDTSNKSGFSIIANAATPGRIRVQMWDGGSTSRVKKDYNGVLVPGAWTMLTIYRNGNDEGLYVNGSFKAPDVTVQNINFGAGNDTRRIHIASRHPSGSSKWPGRVHSLAFWNSTLTAAEVLAVYNGGSGSTMDLANDSGNYTSSANLMHWWRLGHDLSNLGRDYGLHTTLKDLDFNPNIAVEDVFADAP